ncbi:hypothetical protein JCGZ_10385 [Jatropha curcas]|uniref:Uncharacterized protein n=1 Tax=Jatropha curcas TaxID=180498 RepID=A0A067KGP0_JATCU|nr:hypothetical protein JCGZ_10385 [Jatropha curcas]
MPPPPCHCAIKFPLLVLVSGECSRQGSYDFSLAIDAATPLLISGNLVTTEWLQHLPCRYRSLSLSPFVSKRHNKRGKQSPCFVIGTVCYLCPFSNEMS